ncbi:hypothetical protein SS209_03085 [Salmonella enterica subsp. enterica serovar Senftenberg str. SS209]
MVWY